MAYSANTRAGCFSTKAGKAEQSRPVALWHHLAASLVRGSAGTFDGQLRLLSLLYLASEPDGRHEPRIRQALGYLGWRRSDGPLVDPEAVRDHLWTLTNLLANVADRGALDYVRHLARASAVTVVLGPGPGISVHT